MNRFKIVLITLCIGFPLNASASMVNFGGLWLNFDLQHVLLDIYSTPGYRTPAKVPELVLRPLRLNALERQAAVKRALDLEDTPAGKDPDLHRREQIDATPSKEGKAGARLRRKVRQGGGQVEDALPANNERWFNQYETIRTNSEHGRAAEEHALAAFNVASNNVGQPILFEEIVDDGAPEQYRRPDGVSVDENGLPVVVEVKRKKPQTVVYATRQLRTEEAAAQGMGGRHVVIIETAATSNHVEQFPKPSRGFRDLTTEFRAITSDGYVYRWDAANSEWSRVELPG